MYIINYYQAHTEVRVSNYCVINFNTDLTMREPVRAAGLLTPANWRPNVDPLMAFVVSGELSFNSCLISWMRTGSVSAGNSNSLLSIDIFNSSYLDIAESHLLCA